MLINEMVIFYYLVRLKNFSRTADSLGVSKSFVSKSISKLERDLKTPLLTRSTRQLSLTEAGEVFFQHCQVIVEQAEQGYTTLLNLGEKPTGTLKISAPPAMGLYLLDSILIKFHRDHPQVKLNVVLENRLVNVIQEGYDLVLRSASLADSSLISQKITNFKYILCATPEYLRKNSNIKRLEQLTKHRIALYSDTTAKNRVRQTLHFTHRDKIIDVNVESNICSNNLMLMKQFIVADCCIGILPEFMIKEELAHNHIVQLLPHYHLPDGPIYAIYPQKKLMPVKTKIFLAQLKSSQY